MKMRMLARQGLALPLDISWDRLQLGNTCSGLLPSSSLRGVMENDVPPSAPQSPSPAPPPPPTPVPPPPPLPLPGRAAASLPRKPAGSRGWKIATLVLAILLGVMVVGNIMSFVSSFLLGTSGGLMGDARLQEVMLENNHSA